MTERENNLTPEEEKEYRQLKMKLHDLHPDHGNDAGAREPIPEAVGPKELEDLRNGVQREEENLRTQIQARRINRGNRDDGPEPEIDPF